MPSFISTRSATTAPAAAAPIKACFGENESVLHVDVPLKRRRVAFDFSALQQQHEEAAWTLTTFFSVGDAAAAASTVTAPQVAAGGHPAALGQEVVVATICCSASLVQAASWAASSLKKHSNSKSIISSCNSDSTSKTRRCLIPALASAWAFPLLPPSDHALWWDLGNLEGRWVCWGLFSRPS